MRSHLYSDNYNINEVVNSLIEDAKKHNANVWGEYKDVELVVSPETSADFLKQRFLEAAATLELKKLRLAQNEQKNKDADHDKMVADLRETIAKKEAEFEQLKADAKLHSNAPGFDYDKTIATLTEHLSRRNQHNAALQASLTKRREEKLNLEAKYELALRLLNEANDELTRIRAQPQGTGVRFGVGDRVQVKDSVSDCLGTVEQVLPDGKTYKVEWDHGMTLTYYESDLSPAAPKPSEGAEVVGWNEFGRAVHATPVSTETPEAKFKRGDRVRLDGDVTLLAEVERNTIDGKVCIRYINLPLANLKDEVEKHRLTLVLTK